MDPYARLGDRELDANVAERVFGYEVARDRPDDEGHPRLLVALPHYSSTLASARGAALFLETRHPGAQIDADAGPPCKVTVRMPSGNSYAAQADDEARARCIAMLRALDAEGPGQDTRAISRTDDQAKAFIGEVLSARFPANPIAIMGHLVVLEMGEPRARAVAAQALLNWMATLCGCGEPLAKAAESPDPAIAAAAVHALALLAMGARSVEPALRVALDHPDPGVAMTAAELLARISGPDNAG